MEAVGVLDAHGEALVHVFWGGFGQQEPAGGDEFAHAAEQGDGIAADADVAVHQQHGAPAAFAREAVEG